MKKLIFVWSTVGLLVGCMPILSKYTFISLEGGWADKVIKKGRIQAAGNTNFFTDEINIEYRYELNGFTVHAKLLETSLPSVEFSLENSLGEAQEINIFSNHPCYFNHGLSYEKGADGKLLIPISVDKTLAVYQFVEIDPDSDWTRVNMPNCYKKALPESLYVTLVSLSEKFELRVPLKINRKGYYLHFDGV